MFTGIIECTGTIENVKDVGSNKVFQINNPLVSELKVDQSVSHDGVCLTIEAISGQQCQVTAIAETLEKTNLSNWRPGRIVNLERCMQINARLDGHMVQGHVDAIAICTNVRELDGSWEYRFTIDEKFAPLIIEKGSAAINGISLTIYKVTTSSFTVGIIPYTYNNTNIRDIKVGNKVNIEFDVIGKYVNRMTSLHAARTDLSPDVS